MRSPLVIVSIALFGLSLCGCVATVSKQPVRTVEMPTLNADAVRPKVFLDVHGYNEFRDGRLPEQDVVFKRTVQKHFRRYSEQHQLFSRIETDPWFADQCDYRVELLMFAGNYRPSFFSAMATGASYGIIPTTGDNNYSAMAAVTDKSGALVLSATEKQQEREVIGIAALPLMLNKNARRKWQYASAEEFLTVRILRELMNSSMFAPKPVLAKPLATVDTTPKVKQQPQRKSTTPEKPKSAPDRKQTVPSAVNTPIKDPENSSPEPTSSKTEESKPSVDQQNQADKTLETSNKSTPREKPKSAFDPAALQKIIEQNNKVLNKPSAPKNDQPPVEEQP